MKNYYVPAILFTEDNTYYDQSYFRTITDSFGFTGEADLSGTAINQANAGSSYTGNGSLNNAAAVQSRGGIAFQADGNLSKSAASLVTSVQISWQGQGNLSAVQAINNAVGVIGWSGQGNFSGSGKNTTGGGYSFSGEGNLGTSVVVINGIQSTIKEYFYVTFVVHQNTPELTFLVHPSHSKTFQITQEVP